MQHVLIVIRLNSNTALLSHKESSVSECAGDGREFGFVGNVSVEMVTVDEEATLSLDCHVEDAIGSVVFQWQAQAAGEEGGTVREVEDGERVGIASTASSSVLHIDQVALMDEGVYYCVAADSLTELSKRFIVSVHGKQHTAPLSFATANTICEE